MVSVTCSGGNISDLVQDREVVCGRDGEWYPQLPTCAGNNYYPCKCLTTVNNALYRKTSNKRLASNKSRSLIGAGCTGTLNLENACNYIIYL